MEPHGTRSGRFDLEMNGWSCRHNYSNGYNLMPIVYNEYKYLYWLKIKLWDYYKKNKFSTNLNLPNHPSFDFQLNISGSVRVTLALNT